MHNTTGAAVRLHTPTLGPVLADLASSRPRSKISMENKILGRKGFPPFLAIMTLALLPSSHKRDRVYTILVYLVLLDASFLASRRVQVIRQAEAEREKNHKISPLGQERLGPERYENAGTAWVTMWARTIFGVMYPGPLYRLFWLVYLSMRSIQALLQQLRARDQF
ncbi:hypothetical protein F4808DRAFT_326556 [Astrocystis sublimbata]|nr:hypothetical protein F4808DRAFT_326556 [Astrocystis sublimbata]